MEFGGGCTGQAYDTALGLQNAMKRMPSYTERVSEAVIAAEQALKDLKRMQEIFAQHPEFEELLTLVQRGRV